MIVVKYDGEDKTIKELSEMSGISEDVIRYRLREGYEVEEAIKDLPMKKTIKEYINTQDWHDWVNRRTQDVYIEYFHWCVDNKEAPESKQLFVKQVLQVWPWLHSAPRKLSASVSERIFRLVEYDKPTTM